MYENVYISSFSTNLLSMCKFLNKSQKFKSWTVQGAASLIAYFKIFGYNFEEISKKIKEFPYLNRTFPCNELSLVDDDVVDNIKEWLIEGVQLFDKDITLEESKRRTGYLVSFVLWNSKKCTFELINGIDNKDYKLIDCVLASLCNVGLYDIYEIGSEVYGSPLDLFHYEIVQNLNLKTLYLIPYFEIKEGEGPLSEISYRLTKMFYEYLMWKRKLVKERDDFVIVM